MLTSTRWPTWGRRLQIGGVVLAITGAVLWAGSPAGAAAVISVSPDATLTDGQQVAITVSGWLPEPSGFTLSIVQCASGAVDISLCETIETEETLFFDGDGSGNGALLDYTVEVIGGVCDATHPCSIFALENPGNFAGPDATPGQRSASVEITFDPTATTTTTSSTPTTTTTTTTTTTAPSTTSTTTLPSSTTTTTTKPGGATKSTGAEATPGRPVVTTVSSPSDGTIEISESKIPGLGAPSGMSLLGADVRVTAPAATAADPLSLEFRLDGSLFAAGTDPVAGLVVLRDGAVIGACTGAPDAVPDPCVDRRARSADDVVVGVLTSRASAWNFAVPAGSATSTTSTTSTSASTTTTARQGAATGVTAPVTVTDSPAGAATLPRTGPAPGAIPLLVLGTLLTASGSAVRGRAVRIGSAGLPPGSRGSR